MAFSGRDFLILKDGVAIAGMQETSMSIADSGVDITSKSSIGYRELADFSGTESIDLTATGVLQDATFRAIALGGTGTSKMLTDITIQWGDAATLSGNFRLGAFENAGNHDVEETFSITLMSSGAWAYVEAGA